MRNIKLEHRELESLRNLVDNEIDKLSKMISELVTDIAPAHTSFTLEALILQRSVQRVLKETLR